MENHKIAYTDELTVVYEESTDHLHIRSHFHNTYELIYILDGRVHIEVNSLKYETASGSLIFISHLESHELKLLEFPYKRFYLLIKPQLFQNVIADPRLSSIFKHRPEDFSHVLILNEDDRNPVATLFKQIKQELDSCTVFNLMGVSALLQLLFIRLYRNYPQSFPLTDLTGSTNTIHQIQKIC